MTVKRYHWADLPDAAGFGGEKCHDGPVVVLASDYDAKVAECAQYKAAFVTLDELKSSVDAELAACRALLEAMEHGGVCIWCGEAIDLIGKGMEAAVDWARQHDAACERNPLRARLAELQRSHDYHAARAEQADALEAQAVELDIERKLHDAASKQIGDLADALEARGREVERLKALLREGIETVEMHSLYDEDSKVALRGSFRCVDDCELTQWMDRVIAALAGQGATAAPATDSTAAKL